jgi:signal transduction histidine kinase
MPATQSIDAPPTADGRLSLAEQELLDRLGWFTQVRWFMAAATLGLLAFAWGVLSVKFHRADGTTVVAAPLQVALLIFAYNLAFTLLIWSLKARNLFTRRTIVLLALGQILCDTIAVTALVHFTGGVENCFIILALLPLVIASELLPQPLAYAAAAAAALSINAMAWGEYPFGGQAVLDHVHVDLGGGVAAGGVLHGLHANWIYVLQATAALTVTSFTLVFIASAIANRVRARERELAAAHTRLQALDEAKSFFMRKAGHEMRAPLAAIQSMLEAVAMDTSAYLTGEQQRLIGRAVKRSAALMELVDDLRRYSRLRSAPASEFPMQPIALHELAATICELYAKQAAEAKLTLTCDARPAVVAGNEELLRQLLTNLVTNAIQYTPEGGRIEVSVAAEGPDAVLTVADTGIGISEQARGRLFEEFFRSNEAKQKFAQGSGLGLAICKQIMEVHHGRIEALPRQAGGTVFRATIPSSPCP